MAGQHSSNRCGADSEFEIIQYFVSNFALFSFVAILDCSEIDGSNHAVPANQWRPMDTRFAPSIPGCPGRP